ncbi:TetR/AcrR family transcriptional regulator [Sciscionella marina]|uniref:TetR/AcrR family transcriptional regulator n=1 Tax=Sciscionella marina TaxID=508770 RepID=UPI0003647860|nr:TetR/AcrR family transcriptional regulator [Sciscionella marina]
MAALTRVELQERNRAKVLAAAREILVERGYREAKIDHIAERAGLTRGAVYSNFPGKRALYFGVLAEEAERGAGQDIGGPGEGARDSIGLLARAWVSKLLLANVEQGEARLDVELLSEVLVTEQTRRPFAQLMKLNAILLGLALERGGATGRMVRQAENILTMLHGASQLAAAAPGFLEPFNTVRACEELAGLDLGDTWTPAPIMPKAQPVDEPWPVTEIADAVRAETVRLGGNGVLAVLGLHRLNGIEDAVRAAPEGAEVTAVLVTGEPKELAPLARLVLAQLCGYLRIAFPDRALPAVRVVHDEWGTLAAAVGVPAVSDGTEVAVRVNGGRIVARADGLGACRSAAIWQQV